MPTTTKLRQSTKKTKRSSRLKERIEQTLEDNTTIIFSKKYASYIHKIQRIDAEQLLKTQSGFHGSYLFRTGNNNRNIVLSLYNKSENKIYNYLLTIKNEKLSFIDKNGKEFIGNFEEIIDYMFKNVKPEPIYVNVERT